MTTTLITLGSVTLMATLMATGCAGSAQLVQTDSAGGTVALQGPYMPAMGEARMLMVEHCRSRIDALERGDRVSFRCRAAGEGGPGAVLAKLDSDTDGL